MKLRTVLVLVILGMLLAMPVFAWIWDTTKKQTITGQYPFNTVRQNSAVTGLAEASKPFSLAQLAGENRTNNLFAPRNLNKEQLVTEPVISNQLVGQLKEVWDLPDLYREVCPSIVIVLANNTTSGRNGQGTGFFINDDGNVITNLHVVKDAHTVKIKLLNGNMYNVVNVLEKDVDGDLALLSVDLSGKLVRPLKVNKNLPEPGEDIVVIGSPKWPDLGETYTITRGIVSAITQKIGYGTTVQIDAAINPGSSGSPVFNRKGEIVGVVVSTFIKGQNPQQNTIYQNLNFAISCKQVLKLIDKVIPNNEKLSSGFTLSDANVIYLKALDLIRIHEYEKALPYIEDAINKDYNNVQAWVNKAYALGKLGRYQEALLASEKAIQLDPKNADSWTNKGNALYYLGRYQEALQASEESLQLDPQNVDSWIRKASVLGNLGRNQEALQASEKSLQLDPQNVDSWVNQAALLDALGRYQEALLASEKAVQLGPENAFSWINRASALNYLGRYQEALQVSEKTIQLDPKNADFWMHKASVLDNLGRYQDALQASEKAIQLDPKNADFWTNKAIVLGNLGRYQEALQASETAKKLDHAG